MTFEEEHIVFLAQIGLAVTQWANVEAGIRQTLISAIASTDATALVHGFHAIENFRSRLDFVDSIIHKKPIDKSEKANWKNLSDRIRTASSTRNRIVHNLTQTFPECKPGRRFVLTPWVSAKSPYKSRKPMPPAGSLGTLDICTERLKYYALACEAMNLASRLAGEGEPFPRCDEQPNSPPNLYELSRQIHIAFPPRVQPFPE